jgi:hypothetical protein
MSAAPVAKGFDKGEDFTPSLGMSFKLTAIDALQFERAEKGLHCGIIETTSLYDSCWQ